MLEPTVPIYSETIESLMWKQQDSVGAKAGLKHTIRDHKPDLVTYFYGRNIPIHEDAAAVVVGVVGQ